MVVIFWAVTVHVPIAARVIVVDLDIVRRVPLGAVIVTCGLWPAGTFLMVIVRLVVVLRAVASGPAGPPDPVMPALAAPGRNWTVCSGPDQGHCDAAHTSPEVGRAAEAGTATRPSSTTGNIANGATRPAAFLPSFTQHSFRSRLVAPIADASSQRSESRPRRSFAEEDTRIRPAHHSGGDGKYAETS
jgi:hypothetical protein